jgi:hypothetical protein
LLPSVLGGLNLEGSNVFQKRDLLERRHHRTTKFINPLQCRDVESLFEAVPSLNDVMANIVKRLCLLSQADLPVLSMWH